MFKNKTSNNFEIKCKHLENNRFYNIYKFKTSLTFEDCEHFNKKLNEIQSKIEQGKFLINFMTINRTQRTNRKNNQIEKQEMYFNCNFLLNLENKLVSVCIDAFL